MDDLFPGQIEKLQMSPEHVKVLASFACIEVFSVVPPNEEISIREIGQHIGKSPAAVGEQIAKLVEVGLVYQSGSQKRRSRTEALYTRYGRQTFFDLEEQSLVVFSDFLLQFRSQMKSVERQFRAAYDVMKDDPGYRRYLGIQYSSGYITQEGAEEVAIAVRQLHVRLEEIFDQDIARRESGESLRMQFYSVMAPTQHASKTRSAKKDK